MGRDNNTYAKRQREILKRQKAEDKKVRRKKRKERVGTSEPQEENDQPGSEE